jgi:hypothetical protein
MSLWTVLPLEVRCGFCTAPIAPDTPVWVRRPQGQTPTGKQYRCVACAEACGQAVNAREVDLERFRLERDAALAREAEDRRVDETPAPPRRVKPSVPLRSFEQLSAFAGSIFDGKAARCGREKD